MALKLYDFIRVNLKHSSVLTPTTLAKILAYSGMVTGTGTLVNGRSSTATVLCYAPTANPGDSQVITNCLVGEIRYSGARRVDLADGVVHNAGVNGIIYYDTYANGTAISPKPVILSEPSSTNYGYSLNNYGLVNGLTLSSDTIIAGLQSYILTDSNTGAVAYEIQDLSTSIGISSCSISFYVKRLELSSSTYGVIQFLNGATRFGCVIDAYNATALVLTLFNGVSCGAATVTVGEVTSGWFKVVLQFTTAEATLLSIIIPAAADYSSAYVGTIAKTGSFTLTSPQIEKQANNTSFIPTTTAAVTRAADSINIPYAANFADSIIFAIRISRGIESPTASAETYLSATGRTILAKAAAGTTLNITDGTNTATVAIPETVQTDYIFSFVADTALAQMAVLVSGDGGTTWTTGTTVSYDGSFNGSSVLNLLPTIAAPTNILGVITKSQPFVSITAATDWIKANSATELS